AGARLDVAQADLAAAAQAAERADERQPWRVQLERLELLAARGELERAGGETGELALEQLDGLCARGAFDHAWARARAAWSVACARLGRGHAVRRRVAQRLLQLQEVIMDKTNANDRSAVRAALWADGERTALRELAHEVGEAAPVVAAPSPPRASESDGHTERLLRLHRRLAREDRLEPLLEQVIDAVMELTDAERGAIVVLARDGGRREVTRELGGGAHAMEFSRSVIDRVLGNGEPVLSVDAAADDRFDGSRSISHLNLRSVLAVPLWFRGELVGAIYVDHRLRRGNFAERDLGQVEEFAELAALAIAHARALAEVRAQAAQLAQQHEQLGALLEAREVEVVGLRQRVADSDPGGARHGMVGSSAAMQRVYKLVDRLGDTDVPVVIYGESGTGKELVARAIHRAGARASKPFVAENCGAIPETLLESVLFGHAKGAFTGADKARPGLFEAAHGGTIFLDEVGETSAAMQTKLLRVLQEGEVRRVGENAARPVDVRVIAASNRDLDAMVEQGKFRRDLYYRIHVVRIELPPLRARSDDLPALVEHFLARPGGGRLQVTPATMRVLAGYAWPGNVRELENEVQRWIALCDGAVTPEDLSPALRGREPAVDPDDLRIRPRVDRLERDLIARALERARGNQTRAAELLGLSRFGLQKKLRKLAEEGAGGGDELEGDEG
ncbi:MAG: sigma 54-interacting transcriptional regulator, partial [Nannocystaceae bacterium]|nr:sigma 54-interacting transcriptional regulator [Nannocystaceae bacterium]